MKLRWSANIIVQRVDVFYKFLNNSRIVYPKWELKAAGIKGVLFDRIGTLGAKGMSCGNFNSGLNYY